MSDEGFITMTVIIGFILLFAAIVYKVEQEGPQRQAICKSLNAELSYDMCVRNGEVVRIFGRGGK